MRVATYRRAGIPIAIEEVPDPRPEPGDVIVEIARCGICGSDVSMTSGSPFDYEEGWRMGHEYAGEVVEVGPAVENLEVGDRVACMPGVGCGTCEPCRRGQFVFCPSVRSFGGGFAPFAAVDARSAFRLPEGFSMSDGALVEPLAVGLHALNMARFQGGENLLVLGAGSMALAVVYWARRLGAAQITVASRSAHRRDVATAMGADTVVGFDETDLETFRTTTTSLDVVAECVGKPGMVDLGVQIVRPGGTLISLGMCTQSEPVLPALCAFKDVRMFFPIAYSTAEFEQTTNALASGHIHPEIMVSEVIGLDALSDKIEALRGGSKSLKVLVDPSLSD
jgi:(R,R)-butanediol dehydrogenase/meso-butanediol dehydrogenase/diacetyl reductase